MQEVAQSVCDFSSYRTVPRGASASETKSTDPSALMPAREHSVDMTHGGTDISGNSRNIENGCLTRNKDSDGSVSSIKNGILDDENDGDVSLNEFADRLARKSFFLIQKLSELLISDYDTTSCEYQSLAIEIDEYIQKYLL